MQRLLALFFVISALAGLHAHALAPLDGSQLRDQGNLQQSIDVLRAAVQMAATADERARAEGELGVSQLQVRDFAAAGLSLSKAYHYFKGSERARYAIHLGNLSARRKLPAEAVRYYKEALALAANDSDLAINAELNLESVATQAGKPQRLHILSRDVTAAAVTRQSAAFHLNLASQAWQLPAADASLAYPHAERARQLALAQGNHRLGIEAEDLLASMYEAQGRHEEALATTQDALAHLRLAVFTQRTPLPVQGQMADLLIALEWRQGRLRERLGARDGALAAYERAAAQLQASRDDIPIEYDNGRSSFQETIAPLYLGYASLLLAHSDTQAPAQRAATLRRVLDAMEQIKQAELQDYLGDRCVVEAVQGGTGNALPPGVALLYPIIFPDRVELLLETKDGIVRRTTTVERSLLAAASSKLALALRDGVNSFMAPSRQLYDWLLRPFDQVWKDGRITTLVVVPDGALRLLPFSVLHDGERYAVEKFAVSTVTGMTMTNRAKARHQGVEALVVGVSDPGPVVDKLSGKMASGILQPGSARALDGLASTRTLRTLAALRGTARTAGETEQLRISLQLPGVKQEIDALAGVLPGSHLLNADFTVDQFRNETRGGAYRILHIASHGVFGGNAESSFIMAYDDVLTMNGLQALLKSDKFSRAPVELLSLSACETAEGNERAPLGISGAAIKARAKSVLGTLWPLEDNAAQQVMTRFYQGLTTGGLGKAEALRQAQLALIDDPNLAHPFFWGSFILIGNWQ